MRFDITYEALMKMLREIGLFALLTLILGIVPLIMAVVFMVRPRSATWR